MNELERMKNMPRDQFNKAWDAHVHQLKIVSTTDFYKKPCKHSMKKFKIADSNGGMYCTICQPEVFA